MPGEYVSVTTDTRVFDGIDAYAVESNVCAGYLGQFVRDAIVQVLSAELDERGNGWYEVRFLYGDDFADGTMKWTDYATCFVMAAETGPSDGDACTVTDFAYSQDEMRQMQSMSVSLMSTPMNGFSLKNINGSVGGFYAGNPRSMAVRARTAPIRRSQSPHPMGRSTRRLTIWRASPSTAWSTISPAPVKAPAPARPPKGPMCWWIWMTL